MAIFNSYVTNYQMVFIFIFSDFSPQPAMPACLVQKTHMDPCSGFTSTRKHLPRGVPLDFRSNTHTHIYIYSKGKLTEKPVVLEFLDIIGSNP